MLQVLSCWRYSFGEERIERACTLESDGPFGDSPPPLFQAVVDSVLAVRKPGEPIDLHMVEIMEMKHKSETDTT